MANELLIFVLACSSTGLDGKDFLEVYLLVRVVSRARFFLNCSNFLGV